MKLLKLYKRFHGERLNRKRYAQETGTASTVELATTVIRVIFVRKLLGFSLLAEVLHDKCNMEC